MNKPHVHAELIKAWADGAEIEYNSGGSWNSCVGGPCWGRNTLYRIKPEPKPDVMRLATITYRHQEPKRYGQENVKFTFCGETLTLKAVEMLK